MPDTQPPIVKGTAGFLAFLGATRTAYGPNHACFALDLAPHHLNPMGIPHGGVYATLLDTALGTAGCWQGDPDHYRPSVTLNLNVSYLSQPKGTRLICEARRVGGGKSIYFSEGELRDETGVVLARATGTFKVIQSSAGKTN